MFAMVWRMVMRVIGHMLGMAGRKVMQSGMLGLLR
jgi:hypothetical protein